VTDSGTDGRTGVSKERAIAYMLSRANNKSGNNNNDQFVMFYLRMHDKNNGALITTIK